MGLTNPPYDDTYLLRFLRARKFDIPKTEIMFKNFIKWRVDNDIDNIESYQFPEIEQVKAHYPHGYYKTDKLVSKILYFRADQFILNVLAKLMFLKFSKKLQMKDF